MEYKTVEQLEAVAKVHTEPSAPPQTRAERLMRWAELLERQPARQLNSLHGTEFQFPPVRNRMRADNSPISVASEDPLLRAAGLKDDTYGEAKRFFQISDHELHEIVCYCHHGSTMLAGGSARSVRSVVEESAGLAASSPGIISRIEAFLAR